MAAIESWSNLGHAIVNATFAVDLSASPPPATIRELIALHSKLSEDYPRKRETTGHRIGIASDAETSVVVHAAVDPPVLTGFTFDRLHPDGNIERAIKMEGNKLVVIRADYKTWEDTWPEVRSIFKLMLPILMERLDVRAFHLQYLDRLRWTGERSAFRAEFVFRKDSELLAPHVVKVPDLWHSYHGFFDYLKEPETHQQLNVIEAQVHTPENLGLIAEIRLNHRSIPGLEKPVVSGRERSLTKVHEVLGEGDAPGLLDAYMNRMHDTSKLLLARLINDDMCEKIGLPKPE